MNLCRLLLPVCLLLAWPLAAADSPLRDYYQDSWNTRNGLPHNSINSMAQPPEGYLWFATWEGVSRYNGRGFHTFVRGQQTGLPDSGIRGLTPDGDGLLVVGARGGFSRYQYPQWQPQSSLPARVNHVLRDRLGRLWFATEGDGLYMREPQGTQHHFSSAQGLPGLAVYRLLQTADGRVWAGTSQGLAVISADNGITVSEHIPAVPVLALLQTQQGQLLVGSGQGLYGSDGNGGFAPLHPQLASEAISSLLEDNRGDLWIGTTDRGLARLSEFGLERMGNTLWLGTYTHGLIALEPGREPRIIDRRQGLSADEVRAILPARDGSLWVGTAEGLSLTVSLGLAEAAGAGSEDRLLAHADQALYRAKNNGRNRVELWS